MGIIEVQHGKESPDLEFMKLVCSEGLPMLRGESLSKDDLLYRIKMSPMLCEDPELQRMIYLLHESTLRSITADYSEGYQFHF